MHYLDFCEKLDSQPINAASFGKVITCIQPFSKEVKYSVFYDSQVGVIMEFSLIKDPINMHVHVKEEGKHLLQKNTGYYKESPPVVFSYTFSANS